MVVDVALIQLLVLLPAAIESLRNLAKTSTTEDRQNVDDLIEKFDQGFDALYEVVQHILTLHKLSSVMSRCIESYDASLSEHHLQLTLKGTSFKNFEDLLGKWLLLNNTELVHIEGARAGDAEERLHEVDDGIVKSLERLTKVIASVDNDLREYCDTPSVQNRKDTVKGLGDFRQIAGTIVSRADSQTSKLLNMLAGSLTRRTPEV